MRMKNKIRVEDLLGHPGAPTIPKVPRKSSFSRAALGVSNRVDRPLLTMSQTARENWLLRYQEQTAAGTKVTEENALTIDTVLTCVRVLGESMAALPLDLMRREGEDEKEKIVKATDHPAYRLIRKRPNPEMSAYEMRLWMMVDCLIRGRGVAQVQRNGLGEPIALWPLLARHLSPKRAPDDDRLVYTYSWVDGRGGQKEILLEANEVLQIQMLPYGGLIGFTLIQLQREALGASKAAEAYSSEFFANGGAVTGVIEVPETLDEEAYQRLKKDWKDSHTRKGKRHGVPILEGDAKFHPLALNHEETQLLETRKFQRSTIAGLFRVPAHLINDLEKATFSNIEHQDLGFAKHSLRPWMTNWEQRCDMALLSEDEQARDELFFKHDDRDLLRGDFPSRAAAYGTLINSGVMSPNDARRAEDMNPYEGGDVYLVQGALRDIRTPAVGTTPAPAVPQEPEEEDTQPEQE